MATNTDITLYVGALASIAASIKQSDGVTAQNMTGWTVTFTLNNHSGVAAVAKSSATSGIVISNGSGTNDLATVSIAATDTSGILQGVYDYAIWRDDGVNLVPLVYGKATLQKLAGP